MNTPATQPLTRIAMLGGGLTLRMAAAALARHLPPTIQVTCINIEDAPASDLFLGSLAPPSAYGFNLIAGVSEPKLLLETATAFSWGTQFTDWGGERRSWVQCFHLPLPVISGIQFHQLLARQGVQDLGPYLLSAMAARQGVFAHPLEKGAQLLARGEYGYQFDAQSYQAPFAAAALAGPVRVVAAKLVEVERGGEGIAGLRLSDGQTVRADLYIDCSGPPATLFSRLEGRFAGGRHLRAAMSRLPAAELGAPCRQVRGAVYGWQSLTPLQGVTAKLTVYAPDAESQALADHGEPQVTTDALIGRYSRAWSGNCVALGQAAAVFEPLTQAPLLLLQRDVERLASLIPFSTDMSMERREYNRQFEQDSLHADLFQRALFETAAPEGSAYWRAACREPVPEKLAVKIQQYKNRGLLVAYDLEPFNAEDWTILHHGMGRWPVRHDRIADRPSDADVQQYLMTRRREVEKLVAAMPSHHRYMTQLVQHLRQRKL